MKEIVAEAVQNEIRSALEDELVDVERAAEMLDMSEGALRKAVERGQVPCQRIGNRLRFRRMDLISPRTQPRSKARAATRVNDGFDGREKRIRLARRCRK